MQKYQNVKKNKKKEKKKEKKKKKKERKKNKKTAFFNPNILLVIASDY